MASNLEHLPENQAKFIQITSVNNRIIALDEEGNVWRYAWGNDYTLSPKGKWHLINGDRYVKSEEE